MKTNETPLYDVTDNETNCCPRFHPEPWDNQTLHFDNKPFVRASTVSLFHVPLNMGSVFSRTFSAIKEAHAEGGGFLVLSHEESPWHAEHLFAVATPVAGADMVYLTGDFQVKVFEGSFSNAPRWRDELADSVKTSGKQLETTYFFYTTCPRCAKHYGRNYVVGLAKVR